MEPMKLASLGRLISGRRCAQGLTLGTLAAAAGVGRSTLAALESGKLPELGFNKVARICAAVGILLDTRPPLLEPRRRDLVEATAREFTKPVIKHMVLHGDTGAWEELLRVLQTDQRGLLAERVRLVVGTLDRNDSNVIAFTALLPLIMRRAIARAAEQPLKPRAAYP